MRLGLVVAEIGNLNKIEVTEEEHQQALIAEVRRFQGQEQQVYDYYRKNPQALAGLRAPVFENKVVDFVTELANQTEKKMTRAELATDHPGRRATKCPKSTTTEAGSIRSFERPSGNGRPFCLCRRRLGSGSSCAGMNFSHLREKAIRSRPCPTKTEASSSLRPRCHAPMRWRWRRVCHRWR